MPWWTQTENEKNFGDNLVSLIVDRGLIAPIFRAERYYLLGSVLDDGLVLRDLTHLPSPDGLLAYWGCGARSANGISEGLRSRLAIFGARGPRTREALGLPLDTPLGDPGFLVPLLHHPLPDSRTRGRSLCVPHFMDPTPPDVMTEKTGVDVTIRPCVQNMDDEVRMVDAIASADFVLAGSLHAAILACAFGRPFAFLDRGFVDTPFKWRDLADLLQIELQFAADLPQALEQSQRVSKAIRRPALLPLLACCPWAIRPSLLVSALRHDSQADGARAMNVEELQPLICSFEEWQQGVVTAARKSIEHERSTYDKATDVALGQLRRNLGYHAEALQRVASELGHALSAQAAAIPFRFFDTCNNPALLEFAEGCAGAAMLVGDWAPSNHIGPVSIGRWMQVHLHDTTEWHKADRLFLESLIFAPTLPPFDGERTIRLYLNGTLALQQTVVNTSGEETTSVCLDVPIAPILRKRRGPLHIEFQFDVFATPAEIGLREDPRLIGLIPLKMWAARGQAGE